MESATQPKAEGPPESETPTTLTNTDAAGHDEDNKTTPNGGEAVSDYKKEEVEDDDDAFDNREPSPVVPHPYIEFLPFEPGSKPQRDKKTTEGVVQ